MHPREGWESTLGFFLGVILLCKSGGTGYPPLKKFKIFPTFTLRSFNLKENHLGTAVSEILLYTKKHRHPVTQSYETL